MYKIHRDIFESDIVFLGPNQTIWDSLFRNIYTGFTDWSVITYYNYKYLHRKLIEINKNIKVLSITKTRRLADDILGQLIFIEENNITFYYWSNLW